MEFEFDPKKSDSNKHKHGINFVEGQVLRADPERLEIPARTVGEQRYMLIGKIEGKYWSAIFMTRDGKTRIISIRHPIIRRLKHKIWANSLVFQSESSGFLLINSEFTLSRDKVRQDPGIKEIEAYED